MVKERAHHAFAEKRCLARVRRTESSEPQKRVPEIREVGWLDGQGERCQQKKKKLLEGSFAPDPRVTNPTKVSMKSEGSKGGGSTAESMQPSPRMEFSAAQGPWTLCQDARCEPIEKGSGQPGRQPGGSEA